MKTASADASQSVPDAAERYRRILDSVSDLVFCKSPSLQLTFANRAMQEYYGRSEEELVGPTDPARNVVSSTEQHQRDDRDVFATGRPVVRLEEPNVGRDGIVHYFHTVRSPIRDADGKIVELVGVSRDVTNLRANRMAVERTQTHLELALDAGRLGTWEWDIESNLVTWSVREEELYGLAPGAFTGTVDDYRSRIHPDDLQSSWLAVEAALKAKAHEHHIVHRIIRTDGSVRWLESHGRFIYADDGRALRLVGISADVTDRMESQEALRREASATEAARRELLRILEQAPAMISITQMPAGRIAYMNALSREVVGGRDLTGLTAVEIFPDEEQLKPFLDIQRRVFETGQPYTGQQLPLYLDLDGDGVPEQRYFNIVYAELRGPEGRPDAVMSFSVDVTEQVLAQRAMQARTQELSNMARALAESNRDLDQFAYVASHDLKAPLRGIANLAQWIEEDAAASLPEQSRDHLRLLKGRVERMEALIDGVLTYSRAGRTRERPQLVAVGDLVREVVELLAPASTRVTIADDLPELHTHRTQLQQVFLNLIGNAIKHARRADSVVRVSSRQADGVVEFSVADNGPGIAPEFHDRIWGIFQTLEARDQVEGTGIGLAVVKKLVEARGGKVAVDSTAGNGATFRFTWPETDTTLQGNP